MEQSERNPGCHGCVIVVGNSHAVYFGYNLALFTVTNMDSSESETDDFDPIEDVDEQWGEQIEEDQRYNSELTSAETTAVDPGMSARDLQPLIGDRRHGGCGA